MADRILEALAGTPVVVVHGPRQAGKSTLVRQLASTVHPATYVTLDDLAPRRAAAAASPVARNGARMARQQAQTPMLGSSVASLAGSSWVWPTATMALRAVPIGHGGQDSPRNVYSLASPQALRRPLGIFIEGSRRGSCRTFTPNPWMTPDPAGCLPHVSPLVWDHIQLTGEYRWRLRD